MILAMLYLVSAENCPAFVNSATHHFYDHRILDHIFTRQSKLELCIRARPIKLSTPYYRAPSMRFAPALIFSARLAEYTQPALA
jgi:hypothetical protein